MTSSGSSFDSLPQPIVPVVKRSGRKGVPKVRTGCITCKIRKVKCDELKPSCSRCLSTGRNCDGYAPPKPATSSRKRFPSLGPSTNPTRRYGTQLESYVFDYYRNNTASQLGELLDIDFWGGLVLQLALTESAVRHAITAIGMLYAGHVCARPPMGRVESRKTALIEYGKAITAVRSWTFVDESETLPLLVCLLFICIEFLLGYEHKNAAQMHMLQGRKILAGIKDKKSPTVDIVRKEMAPIYMRLSLASSLFAGRPASIPKYLLKHAIVPPSFASMADARNSLYHIIDESFRFIAAIPLHFADAEGSCIDRRRALPPSPIHTGVCIDDPNEIVKLREEQANLFSQLAQWKKAFSDLAAATDLDKPTKRLMTLLRMHSGTTTLWLEVVMASCEKDCDKHVADAAAIVHDAEFIVNYDAEQVFKPSFTFETEVVAPLYWIALKCRQPSLRRRALRLLKNSHRQQRVENMWSPKYAIAVATRVMEIEEEGLQVPPNVATTGQKRANSWRPCGIDLHGPCILPKESSEEPVGNWPVMWALRDLSPALPPEPYSAHRPEEQEAYNRGLAEGWPVERLTWPFGIAHESRLLNVVIESRTEAGAWIKYYRDPNPGSGDWAVKREYVCHHEPTEDEVR